MQCRRSSSLASVVDNVLVPSMSCRMPAAYRRTRHGMRGFGRGPRAVTDCQLKLDICQAWVMTADTAQAISR